MSKPLKLIAQTVEDISIISGLLQDTTVRVGDITWSPAEHRFVFVGNRYVWEKKRLFSRPKGERVRTGFQVNSIASAQLHGVDLSDVDTVLELLNIETQENDDGFSVQLNFSGGAAIRLQTEAIDAVATDLSENWQAMARPSHD